MRVLATGLFVALLALPFGAPPKACEGYASADVLAASDDGQAAFAQATTADATKKPAKKKVAAKKRPKEKVEYMRAAPM